MLTNWGCTRLIFLVLFTKPGAQFQDMEAFGYSKQKATSQWISRHKHSADEHGLLKTTVLFITGICFWAHRTKNGHLAGDMSC